MVPYNQQLDKEKLEASDLVAGQNIALKKRDKTIIFQLLCTRNTNT